jgi:urease accessory protein
LLDSPLALAGQRCIGTVFLLCGSTIARDRREHLLELARSAIGEHALAATAGVTAPHDQVLMLRVLAPLVEPAMDLMRRIWQVWRRGAWDLDAPAPRIWST